LGDMARAMSVFKANAIALLSYQREIETLNSRFHFALENMSRGLSMFDAQHRLIVCNERYRELYRLPSDAVKPGTPFDVILDLRFVAGTGRVGDAINGQRLSWPMDEGTGAGRDMIPLTHVLTDGRTIQISFQPIDSGGWVALHEDITEERIQEARIERLARMDAVTNIANRYAFQETLARVLSGDGTDCAFAVHLIDLDRFKEVNDTFGHPVGDTLLQHVAARLSHAVRADDFVARLGGDEFAVIQVQFGCAPDAEALAARLINVLSVPYDLQGHRIEIGTSLGVVMAAQTGANADDLLRNADIALYRAKSEGRGRYVVFHAEIEHELKAHRSLEADLAIAIGEGAFDMHYQPILDLKLGTVVVCEALLRWNHSVRGFVSPAVFIPLAEESGAIVALGAWALERACRDALTWPPHVKVAVNLSATQFQNGDLFETIERVLAVTGLAAQRLEIEITETVLLRDDKATIATLHQIRALGISIALDDFGTGFASLSYLRSFPFDKIKIDQTFIRDLPNQAECVAIVGAVTALAKTLGMKTVAEGIETTDHLQRVVAAGCDQAQGYLLSRPVALGQLGEALKTALSPLRLAA
jgi:diguanylate cyclase (GGDEF)-like protein